MKCPNCGYEIPDGKLYCEKCGEELVIFSDIDLELEMKNTMSDIASSEFGTETKEEKKPSVKKQASSSQKTSSGKAKTSQEKKKKDKYEDMEYDEDDNPSLIGAIFRRGTKAGWMFYVVILALILAVVIFGYKYYVKLSYPRTLEYQIEMAASEAEAGQYLSAIEYLDKASELDPNNSEYKFTIAEYYEDQLENVTNAIYTYVEIGENTDYEITDRTKAYEKAIALYKERSEYDSISSLLAECDLENVRSEFSNYLVEAPSFSIEEGTYTEKQYLTLSTSDGSEIYYTLDGSDPETNGILYEGPLALEYGSYTIKAISKNDYDIPSDTVVKKYLLDTSFTFTVDVTPDSGAYDKAFFVEVDVPLMYTCYYTTDGTDPDKSAKKYTAKIPVPIGDSTYRFIVYASDGTQSEIVERDYNVTLNTDIDAAAAVSALNQHLRDTGYLDATGAHREGVDGTYIFMYSTIYHIDEMGDYYIVVEYIQDAYGNNKKTGTIYAVDCYNASLYTVSESGDGYTLTPLP